MIISGDLVETCDMLGDSVTGVVFHSCDQPMEAVFSIRNWHHLLFILFIESVVEWVAASEPHLQVLRQTFEALDANGDGLLTSQELKVRSCRAHLSTEWIWSGWSQLVTIGHNWVL